MKLEPVMNFAGYVLRIEVYREGVVDALSKRWRSVAKPLPCIASLRHEHFLGTGGSAFSGKCRTRSSPLTCFIIRGHSKRTLWAEHCLLNTEPTHMSLLTANSLSKSFGAEDLF